MNTEKIVIGILGEKGGGKETVGDLILQHFEKTGAVRIRSSDVLAETLTLWGLPLNRHNLQHLAIIMNKGYGLGTLSTAIRNRIQSSGKRIVLFDGVRWESDVELVKSFKHHFLIYVTADPHIRYERSKKRKQKVGEDLITFEQFLEEEKVATEVNIPIFGKDADFKIVNNGTLEELVVQVQGILANPLTLSIK